MANEGYSPAKRDIFPNNFFRAELLKAIKYLEISYRMVYILHHFFQSGLLGDNKLHAIDSTELVNDCKLPLATLDMNGKKIRIYSDIDSDCRKRRNR